MAKITQTSKFVKLLVREGGATSVELQNAMKRRWAPTRYQLTPIAAKLGFDLWTKRADVNDDRVRYYFTPKA
jgi:hypothetical protein